MSVAHAAAAADSAGAVLSAHYTAAPASSRATADSMCVRLLAPLSTSPRFIDGAASDPELAAPGVQHSLETREERVGRSENG